MKIEFLVMMLKKMHVLEGEEVEFKMRLSDDNLLK